MRIAFDLDGTLADFAGAYDAVARRVLPRPPGEGPDIPEADAPDGPSTPGGERRIWGAIESIDNFWTTLEPIEPGLIAAVHEQTVRYGWDTFFVTQRPATSGDTVQRQTQRWLVEQGFPLPSVIAHRDSRGKLAAGLALDFLVDDTVEHCVDVLEASRAKPVLIRRKPDATVETNAKRLGIATCRTAAEALDLIVRQQPRRKARFPRIQ